MMKRSILIVAVCVLVVMVAFGCKKKEGAAPTAAQPAAMQAAPAAVPMNSALSGKVVETMNSGGYTYLYLENSGKKTWVAIPQSSVKVGQLVSCQPGMEMRNFTSKTLNRTFESIYFSGGMM